MMIEQIGKYISFPFLIIQYNQIQLALKEPEKKIRYTMPIVEILFMNILLVFVLNIMAKYRPK